MTLNFVKKNVCVFFGMLGFLRGLLSVMLALIYIKEAAKRTQPKNFNLASKNCTSRREQILL